MSKVKQDWTLVNCNLSYLSPKDDNVLEVEINRIIETALLFGTHIPIETEIGRKGGGWWLNRRSRNSLQEMLEYCRKYKRVSYIIVNKPERYMRSASKMKQYESEFKKLGVEVHYITLGKGLL